jgi:hypothetical protein
MGPRRGLGGRWNETRILLRGLRGCGDQSIQAVFEVRSGRCVEAKG